MLDKIMHKGDLYFPDLSGKKLKSVNNVDGFFIGATSDGDIPEIFTSSSSTNLPSGSYRLYLIDPSVLHEGTNTNIEAFDLMSYIQNGGVFNSLLTHIKQAFKVSLLKRGALNA